MKKLDKVCRVFNVVLGIVYVPLSLLSWLLLILDFIDRCHCDSLRAVLRTVARLHGACGRTSLASLYLPPAAIGSLPIKG